jgi:hypothetical protein
MHLLPIMTAACSMSATGTPAEVSSSAGLLAAQQSAGSSSAAEASRASGWAALLARLGVGTSAALTSSSGMAQDGSSAAVLDDISSPALDATTAPPLNSSLMPQNLASATDAVADALKISSDAAGKVESPRVGEAVIQMLSAQESDDDAAGVERTSESRNTKSADPGVKTRLSSAPRTEDSTVGTTAVDASTIALPVLAVTAEVAALKSAEQPGADTVSGSPLLDRALSGVAALPRQAHSAVFDLAQEQAATSASTGGSVPLSEANATISEGQSAASSVSEIQFSATQDVAAPAVPSKQQTFTRTSAAEAQSQDTGSRQSVSAAVLQAANSMADQVPSQNVAAGAAQATEARSSAQAHKSITASARVNAAEAVQSSGVANDATIAVPVPVQSHAAALVAQQPAANSTSAAAITPGATIAALDSGDTSGQVTWTQTGPHHAEAGIDDPVLGWVSVRAQTDANGVHASIVPVSQDAALSLGAHMAGLHAYLAERHAGVDSVQVTAPQSGLSGFDASAQNGQGDAMNRGGSEQQTDSAPRWSAATEAGAGAAAQVLERAMEGPVFAGDGSTGRTISVLA